MLACLLACYTHFDCCLCALSDPPQVPRILTPVVLSLLTWRILIAACASSYPPQVPRILNPVVLVLDELPRLYRDSKLHNYIDATFGGLEECRKAILVDFCRHAFDGSGADNFFDAGECKRPDGKCSVTLLDGPADFV